MSLLLLIMTLAHAAKPPICKQDLSDYPLPGREKAYWMPKNFLEGAVRPSLLRLQEDACRCLPRRSSRWPHVIVGDVWTQPNQGKIRIEYTIKEDATPQLERMLECMGEPILVVDPMPYKSDIVYPDGREEVFPRFPLWLYVTE
jgi:hypothetical protein